MIASIAGIEKATTFNAAGHHNNSGDTGNHGNSGNSTKARG
jgi:hypothetical protein